MSFDFDLGPVPNLRIKTQFMIDYLTFPRVAKRDKPGNVWIFVQLIFGPSQSTIQLYKNPNIA